MPWFSHRPFSQIASAVQSLTFAELCCSTTTSVRSTETLSRSWPGRGSSSGLAMDPVEPETIADALAGLGRIDHLVIASAEGLRNCETAPLQASRGWGRPRSEVAQRKQCLSRVAVAASGENQPEARLIMRAAMATTCATIRASRDPVELKRATILLGQPARRELEVSIKPGT